MIESALMRLHQTPGKILVVDDEAENVEVLRRLMTRFGYEVLTALGTFTPCSTIALGSCRWCSSPA